MLRDPQSHGLGTAGQSSDRGVAHAVRIRSAGGTVRTSGQYLAAALLFATIAWPAGSIQAHSQQQSPRNVTRTQADAEITPVTVDRLRDQANQYLGRAVILEGTIKNVLGPRLFTIGEQNF